MQKNEIKRLTDILAEGVRVRSNDGTLEELLGLPDVANGALGDILGGFTNTENLKAILGNLSTTKRLGQILGGLDETDTLKAILGAFTATENIKAILGNLTTTKNLGGILGAFDTTENLKALLGDLDTTTPKQLGQILGALTHTDNLKAIIGAFTATNNLKQLMDMGSRPSIHLYDGWQDEAAIDLTIWTPTNPATGAAWSRGASGAYLRATSSPNANETARLRSNQRWVAAPDTYGTNTVLRKLVLEFELKLTNVANLDESLTLIGLTPAVGDNRASNDIIGWGINTDVLESITDDAGVETTNTGFLETLANWNKLKIEVYSGHVKFYINESQVADHATNLPDLPMYLNFFIDTDAGGAATIELGVIRVWTEDIAR